MAVNKWDAVDKDDKTMSEFKKKLENDFSFMSYVPFIFISAKTGSGWISFYELINMVAANNSMRITTGGAQRPPIPCNRAGAAPHRQGEAA